MLTLIGMALGGFLGALGLSVVMTLLHLLAVPELTRDPLYGLLWLYTVPPGAVLGGVTGAAMGYRTSGHNLRETGLICVVGGVIVAAFLGPVLLLLLRDSLRWDYLKDFVEVCLPIFGPGFLWACLLIKKGREAMAWSEPNR